MSIEVKSLGLTLGSKLLWNKYLNKVTRALKVTSGLAGRNWGCTPKTLLWMYNLMIIPIVTDEPLIWAKNSSHHHNKRFREDFDSLQSACCPLG